MSVSVPGIILIMKNFFRGLGDKRVFWFWGII